MKMSNKVYDVLKYIAQIVLPALGALYFALAKIWNFPYGNCRNNCCRGYVPWNDSEDQHGSVQQRKSTSGRGRISRTQKQRMSIMASSFFDLLLLTVFLLFWVRYFHYFCLILHYAKR